MRQSTAAIVKKDGLILIARRKSGGSMSEKWEFPGGKVDPGETAEQALKREFMEEFEVQIEVGTCLASHDFSNHDKKYKLLAFETQLLSGDFILHEHTEIKWVRPHEISEFDLAESDRGILPKLNL